jgi:hypothetical protein
MIPSLRGGRSPTKQSPTRGGDCFAILRLRRQKNGGSAQDGSQ